MSYQGVQLTEKEAKKYEGYGKNRSVINFHDVVLKNFTFMGPEAEMFKLLEYCEQEMGVRHSVKYVSEDIVTSTFCIRNPKLLYKFPMLKVTGFILRTDPELGIYEAGVIYIPSGFRYPSKYERIIDYHFDVFDSSFSAYSKSYMWPILKNPTEDFTTRYKDYRPVPTDGNDKVYLKYIFPFKDDMEDNVYIYKEKGVLYRLEKNVSFEIEGVVLKSFKGDIHNVVVPSNVEFIAPGAFKGNEIINSVHLPYLKEIGDEAFAGCVNLKSVIFKNTLNKIGEDAFLGCEKLTELVIPDNVKSIGDGAFLNCGIESLWWPKGVTTISVGMLRNCPNLYEVYIPPEVTTFGRRVFARANTIIIYGEVGSAAEKYASENNMFFKPYDFSKK